ncbi:hypothetical protein [Frondihabitans cladoniiphilus]|uniref:TniQ protein n=1 Tax=Frondihabitans cladoniiphilus TaxID=715785 RepID=A0ABP8W0T3_9MICO
MITRREAALRLDIPLEMANRHGLPKSLTDAEFAELDTNPPAWLQQSRANRTGTKPVWVKLECVVCGFTEDVRPKKWWPEWTYLSCDHHTPGEVPLPADGLARHEVDGIGSRFIAVVDEKPSPAPGHTP